MSASTLSYLGKDYINSDLGEDGKGENARTRIRRTWPL